MLLLTTWSFTDPLDAHTDLYLEAPTDPLEASTVPQQAPH